MTTTISKPNEKTLGEFIKNRFEGFEVFMGGASLEMDITHGLEFEYTDDRKHGNSETVRIYPFILWSDGIYKPCHYWGDEYFLILKR